MSSRSIRDGSVRLGDVSSVARLSLRGAKGDPGPTGVTLHAVINSGGTAMRGNATAFTIRMEAAPTRSRSEATPAPARRLPAWSQFPGQGYRARVLLATVDREGAERVLASAVRHADEAHSPGAWYENALFSALLHLAALECDEVLNAVERMRRIATDAGIGDINIHRYAGRAYALSCDWNAAARHYRTFVRDDLLLGLDEPGARDWVLTHVEEWVTELRDVHGPQAAVISGYAVW